MMPLYHTPPAHTKPTPGVFIGAAWLGWTLGVCGCPPGPAQTVGGLRLHLRLRVGLRLSHSENLSSHIPIIPHTHTLHIQNIVCADSVTRGLVRDHPSMNMKIGTLVPGYVLSANLSL